MITFKIHIAASAGDIGSMSPDELQQVHGSLVEYSDALIHALYPNAHVSSEVFLKATDQLTNTITIQDNPCKFSAVSSPCPPYLQPWQHLAQQYGEIIFRNRQLLINEGLINAIMQANRLYIEWTERDTFHAMAVLLVKYGFSITLILKPGNQLQENEDPLLWLERIAGKTDDIKLKLWVGSQFQSEKHPADSAEPPDIFNLFVQGIFYETGLLIPPPIPDPVSEFNPLAFRVTVNDLPWPMMHTIGPDFFICNLTDDKPENNMANPGKPNHPKFNSGYSMRPITDLEWVKSGGGATTWGSRGLLVLQLSRIIREMQGAFMNRFAAEALQSKNYISPLLKRLFAERYSGDYFTAVLRQLARQGVPIRNLIKIMETMVAAGDYIQSDITLIEFLPQPTVLSVAPNDAFDPEKEPLKMAELVRRALREEISISLSANYNLNALLISPQLEEQLMAQPLQALPESTKNELLQLLDAALDSLAADTHLHAILTVDLVRPLLEEVISVAYPFIKVVSYSELASNVSIVTLGRV